MSRANSCFAPGAIGFAVTLLLTACAHPSRSGQPALGLTRLTGSIQVDGRLDEDGYDRLPAVTEFRVASRPAAKAPITRAWLHWDEAGLWFAFAAQDGAIVASPPTTAEHDVDTQDRVELFLWPEESPEYFCLEVAPEGAVHDYAARLYRRFDDSWTPPGAIFAARRRAGGYDVEGFLPVAALRKMGVRTWRSGTRFHLGLYRADFRPEAPEDPGWLTWIDPNLLRPDFHVRATFAAVELAP